jgi:hypothetical protein
MLRRICIIAAMMFLGIVISSCGGPRKQILGTWMGEDTSRAAGTSKIRYTFSRFPPNADNPFAVDGKFARELTWKDNNLHENGDFQIGADGFLKLLYRERYYQGDSGKKVTENPDGDMLYMISFSKDNKHMTLQQLSVDKSRSYPAIDFVRQ